MRLPSGRMDGPQPLALLLAAPPEAAGADEVLARLHAAAAAGRPTRVLLSGAGLAWAGSAALEAFGDVAVCSANAREAGWTLDTAPAGVRWSSIATWLAQLDEAGRSGLCAVLP